MAGAVAFRQQTRVFVDRELSAAARAARLADYARESVAALIAEGRASRDYTRFVDGREGAPESSVDGNRGVISYLFSYVAEAAVFALSFLRARCPVGTGRYRDSFVVAVNGRPIPAAALNPANIPPGAEICIYNSQPYSRKIDVQMAGKTRLRFSVPPGEFDDAARAVRQRFGNTMDARRVYNLNIPGQYILKRGANAGSPVQSPALILSPLG